VTVVRQGEADCSGKTYQGLSVWYVPAPGFRGTDRFDWDVYGTNDQSHDSVVIQVR
jgi:hypothetical protein